MRNYLLALFVIAPILLAFQNSFSQVTQEWEARYNGAGDSTDYSYLFAVDGSGNVYVTGNSYESETNYDYATVKYNSSGIPQWVQKYNGPGNSGDYAYSIAADDSGNVYVTGYSQGSGTGFDYATIKYNSSGVQQWLQRYNGPGNEIDYAHSIALDCTGNVYVTGFSSGIGTAYDYATIKYNSTGVEQWVQRYNGPGNYYDYAHSIALDDSGYVYVTGFSYGSGTGWDYTTIKYNSSGDSVWVKRYDGPGNSDDYVGSIVLDDACNVYVTGSSYGNGTGSDYATIKYNSSGVQQWIQRYNGPGNETDFAHSIASDGSGNVYVTGESFGGGTFSDYTTIKYNSSGDSVWVKRYNGSGNSEDKAFSIAVDGSGNVYVTGNSYGSGTKYDYATIKYNSSGVQQWLQRYNGPGDSTDYAFSVAVDGSSNVYVTGYSYGSGTGSDYATIKYSQSNGIRQISSIIPEQFSLSQNYPNPFNPVTKINYELPASRHGGRVTNYAKLVVYDVTGKEVVTLVNEKQSPGTYQVEFDAGSLTSGVYFYRLTAGDFSDTKRMLLVK